MKQSENASCCIQEKSRNRFDPRTKIVLLILLDILLFMGRSLFYESCVILFCALIVALGGQSKSALKFVAAFFVFAVTEYIIAPYMDMFVITLIHFIAVCVRKVLPCFMLAKWIVTSTKVSEFVAAMWKIRIPQDVIVTSSVIFRCFPTLKEEWNAIQNAMKMRGIEFSFKNLITSPVQTMEHLLVPMFIAALNISDELSAAALCRGLDNPNPHTCMTTVRFRIYDGIFLTLTLLSFAAVCFLKVRGYSL